MDAWKINHTKWWKIRCMQLDVLDYLEGNMDKQTFLTYMKGDIIELQKAIDEEERI